MEDGYDPTASELYADSEIAYQPTYVTPGPYEDSSDGLSSDEEIEQQHPVRNPTAVSERPHSPRTPKYEPSENPLEDFRRPEYDVHPLLDPSTPAYAPSHTVPSPSELSDASSLAGGYPSPISSMQPSVMTLDEHQQFYQPSIKSNVSSPASIFSNENEEIRTGELVTHDLRSSPPAYPPKSPVNKNLLDVFGEEAEDDNRLNEDFEGFEREEQPESQVDGIIADIFGESDIEEEFEGFAENEIEKELPIETIEGPAVQQQDVQSTAQSDEDDNDSDNADDVFVSDFDKIMAKKKEELRRRRRRNRDIEFLNDSDDQILATISRMRTAAEEDRQLLESNQPATKKLKMIAEVTALLKRADLKAALVENGMLAAITDWLAPLPGHTLPNLLIRDTMLACLSEFQSLSTEVLQDSGIGKALMYLYKHPLETRANKDRAGRLINEWLRPIFNLTSDYRSLTKEERKQLDYEHLPKRRNIDHENYDRRDINRELDGEPKGLLRPGDPGWVGRARVPQPSNKDYIIRPKSRVFDGNRSSGDNDEDADGDEGGEDNQPTFRRRKRPGTLENAPGPTSRIEAHIRRLRQMSQKTQSKASRAVVMSVEGRKMAL